MKKLIQRIDNLSDTKRFKIIDDFRKSLEGIIPDFGKDFLVELDTQLSHFRKSKEFLMYVLLQDDINFVSIGLGLDNFLKKKLVYT